MCCTVHRIYFNSGSPQKMEDLLAQLVEHHTFNVGVMGSNPIGVTNLVKLFIAYKPYYLNKR